MPSIFKLAAQALAAGVNSAAGVPVTYTAGGLSANLTATVGRTEFDVTNEQGVYEKIETRDYLCLANALVLGGSQVLPVKGATITEIADGKTYVYQVVAPGGADHYRFCDVNRVQLRIHTVQIVNPDA